MVAFGLPGAIFDLVSFSFQLPICGSAAKHAAPNKKQTARVNPIVFVFIGSSFPRCVNSVVAGPEGAKNLSGERCPPPDSDPFSNAEFGKNLANKSSQFASALNCRHTTQLQPALLKLSAMISQYFSRRSY